MGKPKIFCKTIDSIVFKIAITRKEWYYCHDPHLYYVIEIGWMIGNSPYGKVYPIQDVSLQAHHGFINKFRFIRDKINTILKYAYNYNTKVIYGDTNYIYN